MPARSHTHTPPVPPLPALPLLTDDSPVVTVRPPWAQLLVTGRKLFEFRRRPLCRADHTPRWVWVHAAGTTDVDQDTWRALFGPDHATGALLGAILVAGWFTKAEARRAGLLTAPAAADSLTWPADCVGWLVRAATLLPTPIPMPGKLSLWPVPPAHRAVLRPQLATARRISRLTVPPLSHPLAQLATGAGTRRATLPAH